jgi:F420-0:gamma-glutamyl ligase
MAKKPPFITPNSGKSLDITLAGGQRYSRLTVKTHVISDKDEIIDVVEKYAAPLLHKEDTIVISERIVAISQGRSFLLEDIKPTWWAHTLSKFVYNHPGGIGLRNPYTMQLAIQEAGLPRILLAATVAVITKPLGMRGMFYRVAGNDINAIDGPCDYTLPPGNNSAKLGPKNPEKVARDISQRVGAPVAIIDANDYGVNVLGVSDGVDRDMIKKAFKDNPMGQTDEQTPITLLRPSRK